MSMLTITNLGIFAVWVVWGLVVARRHARPGSLNFWLYFIGLEERNDDENC